MKDRMEFAMDGTNTRIIVAEVNIGVGDERLVFRGSAGLDVRSGSREPGELAEKFIRALALGLPQIQRKLEVAIKRAVDPGSAPDVDVAFDLDASDGEEMTLVMFIADEDGSAQAFETEVVQPDALELAAQEEEPRLALNFISEYAQMRDPDAFSFKELAQAWSEHCAGRDVPPEEYVDDHHLGKLAALLYIQTRGPLRPPSLGRANVNGGRTTYYWVGQSGDLVFNGKTWSVTKDCAQRRRIEQKRAAEKRGECAVSCHE